jgi:chitinase
VRFYSIQFTTDDLNPNVCTHINFAFARLNANKIEVSDSQNLLAKLNDLRKRNPHLTTLISLGGWGDGSTKYSEMVRSPVSRAVFVHSVVEFLKAHELDGLDFDWEFPAFSGVDGGDRQLGRAEDKQDYVTLLRELREAFKPAGSLLTAALTSAKYNVDHAYDIAAVSQLLDYINLMTYDYHGPWSHATGHNAPLHAPPTASEEDRLSTVEFPVNYFLQHGADAKKLVLGIPLYGYYFQLSGAADHRVGAPVVKGTEGSTYGHVCIHM